MRNVAGALAVAAWLVGPSSFARVEASAERYKTNVTDGEWEAAIPSKESGVKLKLVKGQRSTLASQRRPGKSSHATISVVIRVDGTVGVYRVVETNDPSFARDFIKTLLKQRYEPPLLDGKPVSLRGDEYQVVTFER